MIKEINKNSKKISEINGEEHEDPDYTDEFNKKADVNASNIGYGDLFLEIKDDEGEVIYSEEDNRKDWGLALTNSKNTIASDNVTLVSSQNVYNETHPYMEKDASDHWINPYNYINYKNLSRHEGAEDINKQDRWSEQDIFEPNEPNDNTVKENLVALDTAIGEVAKKLNNKANISLDNLNQNGLLVINGIARGSILVTDEGDDALVRVRKLDPIYDQQYGLYTDVYQVYTDYDPSGGGGDEEEEDDTLYAQILGRNVGRNMLTHDIYGELTQDYSKKAVHDVKQKYQISSDTIAVNTSLSDWGNAISCDNVRDSALIYPISPPSNLQGHFLASLEAIRDEVKLPDTYYNDYTEAYFLKRSDWSNSLYSSYNFSNREKESNLQNILDYAETTGHRLANLQEAILQLGSSMLEVKEKLGITGDSSHTGIIAQQLFTQGRYNPVSETINGNTTTYDRNDYVNYHISGTRYLGRSNNYDKFPRQITYSETSPARRTYHDFDKTVVITPIADRRFTVDYTGCVGLTDITSETTHQETNAQISSIPLFDRIQKIEQTITALAVQVNEMTTCVGQLDKDINDNDNGLKVRVSRLEGNSSGTGGNNSSS